MLSKYLIVHSINRCRRLEHHHTEDTKTWRGIFPLPWVYIFPYGVLPIDMQTGSNPSRQKDEELPIKPSPVRSTNCPPIAHPAMPLSPTAQMLSLHGRSSPPPSHYQACSVVHYYQVAHHPAHKVPCNVTKKSRTALSTAETRLRSIPPDPFTPRLTPSNRTPDHFRGIHGTAPANACLVEALLKVKSYATLV